MHARVFRNSEFFTAAGLLWLRLGTGLILFLVHGWPKVVYYPDELTRIEDPFGFGPQLSLLIAMLIVHPQWALAEDQFGWLLLICTTTIALCGPGSWSVNAWMIGRKDGR